jgi:hypothetical protein
VAQRWGYGMLWWVWDAPTTPGAITGPYSGAYMAMGSNGQFITVLPAADAVVVHKVDIDADETPGALARRANYGTEQQAEDGRGRAKRELEELRKGVRSPEVLSPVSCRRSEAALRPVFSAWRG